MSTGASPADTAVQDPMLHQFELPLTAVYYPFGFPLRVRTNSLEILAAVEEAWGAFTSEFPADPAEFAIGVTGNGCEMPPWPSHRARGHLLTLIGDARNFLVCDLAASYAFCWLTPPVARDLAYLRKYYTDPIGYTLVMHRHLAPVHAACVARNGRGLLLCGQSGAGKSSLSFACARRGWTFIADDFSHLVRERNDRRVLGNSFELRFRASATTLFPELEGRTGVLDRDGEATIEVRTKELGHLQCATSATVEHIVFLNRRPGARPRFNPISKDTAFHELQPAIFFGEDGVRARQKEELRRLLSADMREFTYDGLDAAVDALEELLAEGG
ncbi:MAG: hypothetical protein KIT09_06970 [Bryobacteraceae bacterium]|nr:hypothetical protein [Bryobacteraceae bacterium]